MSILYQPDKLVDKLFFHNHPILSLKKYRKYLFQNYSYVFINYP